MNLTGSVVLKEMRRALADSNERQDRGYDACLDNAANFSKSVAITGAKLLEQFQWSNDNYDFRQVGGEMADVYAYLILLTNHLGFDLNRLAVEKLATNEDRFPADNGEKTDFAPFLDPDSELTTQAVMDLLVGFRQKRIRWTKQDSPANFAKSILIESAELLEHFQWSDVGYDLEQVKYEAADVYIYLLALAAHLDLNLDQLVLDGLASNGQHSPAPASG